MNRFHRYPDVGRCIYCEEPPTGEEHIVPRNLGGMLILPVASCTACGSVTGAIEGHIADGFYKPVRRQFSFPRRKRKQAQAPQSLDLDGQPTLLEDKDFPGLLVAFNFHPPSILKLGPPATEHMGAGIDVKILPEFGDRLNRVRGSRRADQVKFVGSNLDTTLFGRFLCKIAHSYAVAELGLGGFRPYLLEIIKDPNATFIGEFVGGAMMLDNPGADLHEVWLDSFFEKTGHVVVCVRLFSNYGLPTYWVVVGERRKGQRP